MDHRLNSDYVSSGSIDPRVAARDRAMRRNQISADQLLEENRRISDEISREDVPGGRRERRRLAAKEREIRRDQFNAELLREENRGMTDEITRAEVQYDDDDTFVQDGIRIEPFNLTEEREEGYFDDSGNFVEFMCDSEIDEAMDTERNSTRTKSEDETPDLPSEDSGKIKKRIADVLETGETVLQALKRLKGNSNNRKEKMSPETKILFDQLTEDAMKLMENGDCNVYDYKQEIFQREAEV
ncbi:unnamed protein product [Ilex paraguariensis]|uniref:Uncharacterized protein n=1 Tax=Ilex paraguariensis TaxID=185542 RepID=A0ABC8S9G9_9AQUA